MEQSPGRNAHMSNLTLPLIDFISKPCHQTRKSPDKYERCWTFKTCKSEASTVFSSSIAISTSVHSKHQRGIVGGPAHTNITIYQDANFVVVGSWSLDSSDRTTSLKSKNYVIKIINDKRSYQNGERGLKPSSPPLGRGEDLQDTANSV